MAKLRVYELAEQMNKTNKEILSILKDKGIEVASHMSTLSDEQIDAVKSEKTSEDEKYRSGFQTAELTGRRKRP